MTTQTRTPYRFIDNAHNQSNEYGNHILKKGVGELRKPSWQRTETVVRILPVWNFETNGWEPFRRSTAPMDYGDWIRRYESVRNFGEPGVTLLLYDPSAHTSYDIQSNPCVILHRAISQSIDARHCDPDWPALLKGRQGQSAVLGRHSPIYLSRVGIFRIKSKDMATGDRAPLGLAPSDPPFFFQWPKTAGEKLCVMLEEQVDDPKGANENDWKALYKYGDIVSLDAGAYVHIFEEGADPRTNAASYSPGAATRTVTVGGGRGANMGGGGGKNFNGYDMFISESFNGFAAELNTPELERLIKGKQRPWEDCLQFLSHKEQAFLVQDGFPPRAIVYAWKDHPEWIKDETHSKALGRVSVPVDPAITVPADVASAPVHQPKIAEKSTGNVGSWGAEPWNKDAEDGTAKTDAVVPPALDSIPGKQVPAVGTREAKALAALEAAKQRNANR